jgi:poly-gamma-glutamate synthesis protein (capsule biosynthesis protein)
MGKSIEIILCGDLCPTSDTQAHFRDGNEKQIFSDCLPLLKNADYVVGNLEFVLINNPKPIQKSGPVLYGAESYINVFEKSGFDLLSLANNHIKDCGEIGVKTTLETCAKAGINTVGAGHNLQEAKKPYIIEIKGVKIAFLTFAEQEFNTASENEYGASFFNPYEDLDLILETKKRVDHLVVIYHGGIEHYKYPSPLLQTKCRRFIDKGADLVTCQHSHCIGVIEKYKNNSIVYGQGNTLFGYREGDKSWNEGLILKLSIDEAGLKLTYQGVSAVEGGGIRLMTDKENQKLGTDVEDRSKNVYDADFIQKSWLKFCKKKESLYLPQFLALNRYLIHFNRWTNNKLVSSLYRKKYLRTSHNIMRCEAHNEVIQTLLTLNSRE